MNGFFLLFSWSFFNILLLPAVEAGTCNENDKQIVKTCYTSHFNIYNHTMPVYYWTFSNFRFSSINESFAFCSNFETLKTCIGEDRYVSCGTPDLLGPILDKTWSDARDLIYVYRRRQIFCNWLPQLLSTNTSKTKPLDCFMDITSNVCGYKNVIRRPSSDCENYQKYVDCYAGWQVYYCSLPFIYMRCEMLDLHVKTYQSHCNLASFNCTKYNYTTIVSKITVDLNTALELVKTQQFVLKPIMDTLFFYQRLALSTVYVAIFCSMFKKNSPLKSSFFAIFLMVPLYDVFWVITYVLKIVNITQISSYSLTFTLEGDYLDYMTGVLFFMSLNRFTAVNFPLKHKKIWNLPVICLSLLIILILILLSEFIFNQVLWLALITNPVRCQNRMDSFLVCYFNALDYGDWVRELSMGKIKAIINFSICFICFVPLTLTSIRYRFVSKPMSSTVIKAEKRLLIITVIEVTALLCYNIICHFSAIMGKEYAGTVVSLITQFHTTLLFFHHLLSMAVFFIFSKAIRDAYLQFYFLDIIYSKTIKKYIAPDRTVKITDINIKTVQSSPTTNSRQVTVGLTSLKA